MFLNSNTKSVELSEKGRRKAYFLEGDACFHDSSGGSSLQMFHVRFVGGVLLFTNVALRVDTVT